MIVNVRLDVNDEQRQALSLLLHPKAPKRLATRQEFGDHVVGFITLLTKKGEVEQKPVTAREMYRPFDDSQEMSFHTPIKHADEIGTPVVVSKTPLMGFRKLVHHVNCAMFSLANAKRMAPEHSSDSEYQLERLTKDVQMLRDDLANEHDKRDDIED